MKNRFFIYALFGLTALIFLTPFFVFSSLLFPYITSKAFMLRIFVELALPFYLYLLFAQKTARPKLKNPLTLSLLAFLAINIVSAFAGVNPLRSFWGNFERMGGVFYLAHLVLIYFYVLMLGQLSGNWIRRLLYVCITAASLLSVYGVLTKLGLFSDPSLPRVSASFGNPIFLASFLVISLCVTLFFAEQAESKPEKIWLYSSAALQFLVIMFTQTRGALVGIIAGCVAGFIFYLFHTENSTLRRWGSLGLAVFVVAIVLLFSFPTKIPGGRIVNLRDSNTYARLIQWKSAVKGVKDHPMLGVGPENYLVIANTYYNPQLWQYDPSWFDKPHNYLLEILVTNGVVGLAAYGAAIAFSFWIFYKAYKEELVSLAGFAILAGGLLAYQIQNLFVFDTVSASMIFFVFLGFTAYLWSESHASLSTAKEKYEPSGFAVPVLWLSGLGVLYMVYVFNITGMTLAKAVNFGHEYASVDPQKAEDYFESSDAVPVNFYKQEQSFEWANFATSLYNGGNPTNKELFQKVLAEALAHTETASKTNPQEPIVWMKLANLYYMRDRAEGKKDSPQSLEAAQKAVSLAPKRLDPRLLLATMEVRQEKMEESQAVLESLAQDFPKSLDVQWQLAGVYFFNKQQQRGVDAANKVLANETFVVSNASQLDWLIGYYEQEKKFDELVSIITGQINRADDAILKSNLYARLADAYAKMGNKQQAIAAALMVKQLDPTAETEVNNFIQSLH